MALALPPVYLLSAHLPLEVLHDLEDQLPTLTYDITEAKLVLGKVNTKQRAIFELRSRKLWTEEIISNTTELGNGDVDGITEPTTLSRKRRKRRNVNKREDNEISDMDLMSGSEVEIDTLTESPVLGPSPESTRPQDRGRMPTKSILSSVASVEPLPSVEWGDTIKVVKLDWFTGCLAAGHLLPLGNYLIYEGKLVPPPRATSVELKIRKFTKRLHTTEEILSRAKDDTPPKAKDTWTGVHHGRRHLSQTSVTRPTRLLHQTTSELNSPENLPPVPDYLHTTYSCQRPTPLNPPNDLFISQLKKIRTARTLLGDEVGVRAYSTAIASLAAYPYLLISTQEVLRLPGCDQKIAFLYQEWKETGRIHADDDIDSNPKLQVLNLFYKIWGVGSVTAREFYDKGWRDLDDIVEFGWASLTRVQQIGLKYYDEFQVKIPKAELESIAATILSSANKIHSGFHMCIVGGYRRGKLESGDVDVVLSHPDETCTFGFIQDIVEELEKGNWITHTLLLSMANSERGQTPVSWKGEMRKRGSGFDTLDKALLVWQDPNWPSRLEDLKKNPKAKNPGLHRRVDLIISPWKTVGCAVAGWTSGTTFQRDLRRYAKKEKNLRFDSSGIRNRTDGHWVDFESVSGKVNDLLTAEKRVFAGLGLEWREPSERCTG